MVVMGGKGCNWKVGGELVCIFRSHGGLAIPYLDCLPSWDALPVHLMDQCYGFGGICGSLCLLRLFAYPQRGALRSRCDECWETPWNVGDNLGDNCPSGRVTWGLRSSWLMCFGRLLSSSGICYGYKIFRLCLFDRDNIQPQRIITAFKQSFLLSILAHSTPSRLLGKAIDAVQAGLSSTGDIWKETLEASSYKIGMVSSLKTKYQKKEK